ncbi:MAG: BMP family lipoprotein [Candidatus Nanopelagicales bacterium]
MNKRMLAAMGVAAMALGACGTPPGEGGSTGGTGDGSGFRGCMVTDSGGIEDRSFNASAWRGLQKAESELGIQTKLVASNAESDLAPNVNSLVNEDCGLIITVGFTMGQATTDAAKANADEKFAIVDENPAPTQTNIKPLLFNTAEAAYLAGYLAAGMSETGTVATFGGQKLPSVAVFMDGFYDGVHRFNKDNSKDIKLLGWNKGRQDGTFSGNFNSPSDGQNIAKNFIQQGADIIMPVAGGTGTGAAAEAMDSGKAKIIWVDADGYESIPQWKSVILTTVEKNIATAVFETTKETMNGGFNNTAFVGTLENDGVGLAPFHEFEDQVPAELKAKVDALKAEIIAGTTKVTSDNSPKAG